MKNKLVRVKEGSVLAGVCSGVARYFGLETSKVRLAWFISILFFGTGLLLYIVLAIILPKEKVM